MQEIPVTTDTYRSYIWRRYPRIVCSSHKGSVSIFQPSHSGMSAQAWIFPQANSERLSSRTVSSGNQSRPKDPADASGYRCAAGGAGKHSMVGRYPMQSRVV